MKMKMYKENIRVNMTSITLSLFGYFVKAYPSLISKKIFILIKKSFIPYILEKTSEARFPPKAN